MKKGRLLLDGRLVFIWHCDMNHIRITYKSHTKDIDLSACYLLSNRSLFRLIEFLLNSINMKSIFWGVFWKISGRVFLPVGMVLRKTIFGACGWSWDWKGRRKGYERIGDRKER